MFEMLRERQVYFAVLFFIPDRTRGEQHMGKTNRVGKPVKKERRSQVECPQCQEGPEYYRMLFDTFKFDVDLARAIVADDRPSVELEPDDVMHSLEWAHIHRPDLDHIDTRFPGIIAHYWHKAGDELLHGHVLIDGHHRAAKLHEANMPFFVHILTEDESRRVTLRSPVLD